MLSDELIHSGIRNLTEENGLVVFGLSVSKRGRRKDIKVFVDHEWGGITVNQCQDLGTKISDFLFQNHMPASEYFLEVSSPGIGKPLVKERDFKRNRGRKVEVFYSEGEKTVTGTGTIKNVTDDLTIETEKGELVIPFKSVEKGKIIVQW